MQNATLEAADEVFRVTKELVDSEDFSVDEQVAAIRAVLEPYRAIRQRLDLEPMPKEIRAAIEAADELADWLLDFIEVQAEPSTEQWKSLLGVVGAMLHFQEVRAGIGSRAP